MNKAKLLNYFIQGAILLGLIWAGVKYLNLRDIVEAFEHFQWSLLPVMIALSIANFVIKAYRFNTFLQAITKVPSRPILKGYLAGQAATILPGGVLARTALMKQINISPAHSMTAIIISSLQDQVIFVLGLFIAALRYEDARGTAYITLGVLTVLTVLFLFPVFRTWTLSVLRNLSRRLNVLKFQQKFIDSMKEVITPELLRPTFLLTLLATSVTFGILYLAVIGSGVEIAWPALIIAFILPTFLGRLSILPGGVGVTEASMTGLIVLGSHANPDTIVGAVLIYRLVSDLLPVILGGGIYFLWWHGRHEVAS